MFLFCFVSGIVSYVCLCAFLFVHFFQVSLLSERFQVLLSLVLKSYNPFFLFHFCPQNFHFDHLKVTQTTMLDWSPTLDWSDHQPIKWSRVRARDNPNIKDILLLHKKEIHSTSIAKDILFKNKMHVLKNYQWPGTIMKLCTRCGRCQGGGGGVVTSSENTRKLNITNDHLIPSMKVATRFCDG